MFIKAAYARMLKKHIVLIYSHLFNSCHW